MSQLYTIAKHYSYSVLQISRQGLWLQCVCWKLTAVTLIATFTVCLLETSSKGIVVCAGNIMQRVTVTLVKSLYARKLSAKALHRFMVLPCAGNFLQKHYIGLWFYSVPKTSCKRINGFTVHVCVPETSCKSINCFYSVPETSCKRINGFTVCQKLPVNRLMVLQCVCARNFLQKD